MSVFQYYLPGITSQHVNREQLRDVGLGDVLRDVLRDDREFDAHVSRINVQKGPDPESSGGVVVCPLPTDQAKTERIGYYVDYQDWFKAASGRYWIGVDREHPPRSESLARRPLIDGREFLLGDDRVWQVPILRLPNQDTNLPCSWGLDASGEFHATVLREWRDAWRLSARMWKMYIGQTEGIDTPEVFEYCVKILAVNYRIGPQEASILGLLTSENYGDVYRTAIEADLIDELLVEINAENQAQKKSDNPSPAGPSSASPGAGDDTIPTDPVEPPSGSPPVDLETTIPSP